MRRLTVVWLVVMLSGGCAGNAALSQPNSLVVGIGAHTGTYTEYRCKFEHPHIPIDPVLRVNWTAKNWGLNESEAMIRMAGWRVDDTVNGRAICPIHSEEVE